MALFNKVKAFVTNHKTEILVASCVLAGAIIGGACVYKFERKEVYKIRKAFENFNLEHKDKVAITKTLHIDIDVPGSYTDEEFDEVYRLACRCCRNSSFRLRTIRNDYSC